MKTPADKACGATPRILACPPAGPWHRRPASGLQARRDRRPEHFRSCHPSSMLVPYAAFSLRTASSDTADTAGFCRPCLAGKDRSASVCRGQTSKQLAGIHA